VCTRHAASIASVVACVDVLVCALRCTNAKAAFTVERGKAAQEIGM
jgi:hypothetical protein